MKIGVTGTRNGATLDQLASIVDFFKTVPANSELHHGDCVGVDVEVALVAREFGVKTVCHPPTSTSLRGFFDSDSYFPPLGYLARDRKIVDSTELLLVVPFQDT